ncbi:hypothetical protein LR48_Vigan07g134400 [Vigna angularis]|uniref:Uncharacterized protein n=1 Tax=Phaseolus angularis TaxID=3914 RepID=A0A0L9UXQ8_PHAAN|nr:hypothetical protein LR48_Vigan07g134400 [Vigna angularis]
MSAITQNIKINWADLISDTIVRAKRYDRSHLPYPLLISLICIYKGVDVTGEKSLTVLRNHEIEESALHQMGFIRQGNMFVRAEDDIVQEGEASAEEDEDIPMPHPTNVAGPSHPPQEYSLESISRQIEEMASMQQRRMDDMMAYHTLRYDEINNHLKEIDDKLAKLYVPDTKETLSIELVKYCYGDRGIADSSLVHLRKCLEEEFILRDVFEGSVSSFVKIQRRIQLGLVARKLQKLFLKDWTKVEGEEGSELLENYFLLRKHFYNPHHKDLPRLQKRGRCRRKKLVIKVQEEEKIGKGRKVHDDWMQERLQLGKPVKFKNKLWVVKDYKENEVIEIESPHSRRVRKWTRSS